MTTAWKSNRQAISADSSGASETIAAHLGVRDCLTKTEDRLQLLVDNSAVVRNARRGGAGSKLTWLSKALRLRIELLRDLSELDVLRVDYISTLKMRADGLTKSFGPIKIAHARNLLNVC